MSTVDVTNQRVSARDELYADVLDWMNHEAELLDENRFWEWLELMSEDLSYTMPIRNTVLRADGDGVSRSYGHFEETLESLKVRVTRLLNTTSAWAEDPPSRTRHYVTNLRVWRRDEGVVAAKTYLLVLRNRLDLPDYEFVSCERSDLLRREDDEHLKLVNREIIVDQSRLGVVNLSFFL